MKLEENIDILGQNISKDIMAAVKKATASFMKPGAQATIGSASLTVSDNDILKALDGKVDKSNL